MSKANLKKIPAYTLQELLVVLVIIGILILLALPSLMPLISKTKSLEAQMQLKHLYTLQRSHFMLHSKYSFELDDIGFEHEKTINQGGNANYQIEIVEASPSGFLARATALADFDGDGNINVWEIDEEQSLREVLKD
ncbi:prepilin-type N-terminal cleavage/methylation domain-containing protein [Croceimicrobium hydrocarbonivorans]|uniref:Prepilin-type N-terminal cleavage/methylation domain-containing protein n=1 Tax=Croceimicrobium hydrocarbonivorans TaxID=2761580 RepID=A0A7H0VBW7_9FLAO|nr:prepilin-type N-terminal cleavage/methylation domain-containing protein [Croceimicrobium hydrocarbonivorans]QNR23215.1 prepilin-type N-terminal cleavage/methylation domain-containing protein [Croceimicrobium hydrocarbonivorans]